MTQKITIRFRSVAIVVIYVLCSLNGAHGQTKEHLFRDTIVDFFVFKQALANKLNKEFGISNLSQTMDSIENKLANHCDIKKVSDVKIEYNSYLGGSEFTCLCSDYDGHTIVLWYDLYEDKFRKVDLLSDIKFDCTNNHEVIYKVDSIGNNTISLTISYIRVSNLMYKSSVVIQ